ncbi:hypothetical protein PO909_028418 [Leuciscus waleckii]
MKSALKLVLFPFFAMGVYGADEVKSATEGESVTLNSGVTEIQRSDEMEWRLNGNRIFRISSDSNNKVTVFDETKGAYGGRMQPNQQTGDLKITDIKTTDSGQYKLQITSTRGSSEKTFNVSVVPKPVPKPVPEPGPDPGLCSEPGPESGLSSGAIAGIVVGVIVGTVAVGGGIAYGYWKKGQMCKYYSEK